VDSDFVAQRLAQGQYGSVSDYQRIADLYAESGIREYVL